MPEARLLAGRCTKAYQIDCWFLTRNKACRSISVNDRHANRPVAIRQDRPLATKAPGDEGEGRSDTPSALAADSNLVRPVDSLFCESAARRSEKRVVPWELRPAVLAEMFGSFPALCAVDFGSRPARSPGETFVSEAQVRIPVGPAEQLPNQMEEGCSDHPRMWNPDRGSRHGGPRRTENHRPVRAGHLGMGLFDDRFGFGNGAQRLPAPVLRAGWANPDSMTLRP